MCIISGYLLNCSDADLYTISFNVRCVSHRATGLKAYIPQGCLCMESRPHRIRPCATLYRWERKVHRENFRSRGAKSPRTFVPWNFRTPGTFAPRERMLQELSLHGTLAPLEPSLHKQLLCSLTFAFVELSLP